MVARQFGTSIKQLPSDWGPKLICFKGVISEEFLAHTLHFGMELLKEKNKHFVETGITLLIRSGVHMDYWEYNFKTAVYLINKLPSNTLNLLVLLSSCI